ncbi:hypothetical protein SCA6_002795 [Theobroma cacao]
MCVWVNTFMEKHNTKQGKLKINPLLIKFSKEALGSRIVPCWSGQNYVCVGKLIPTTPIGHIQKGLRKRQADSGFGPKPDEKAKVRHSQHQYQHPHPNQHIQKPKKHMFLKRDTLTHNPHERFSSCMQSHRLLLSPSDLTLRPCP